MYTCGPTVWNYAHVGNLRAFLVYDLIRRHLQVSGFDVNHVMNLTDIDDRILDQAMHAGLTIGEHARPYVAAFFEDMTALRAQPATHYPRATEHIPEMIEMITQLIENQNAYVADGDVYFRIASFPAYGALSHLDRGGLKPGIRVATDKYDKESVSDFALWKHAHQDDEKLGGAWDAPFGRGRPGWHIECSAMSEAHLGESFDIHGGGLDLIFPHHENEIAQSVCAHAGRPFVRHWVHNGFLSIDSAKMSKSLGNFFSVRELLDDAPGEAIRLALLSAHYRDPLDWTSERLRQARANLDRFYRALTLSRDPVFERFGEADEAVRPVKDALEDDLNTPLALTRLHELVGAINRTSSDAVRSALQRALEQGGRLMGLLEQDPLGWLRGSVQADELRIEEHIALRATARRQRRFAEADKIRAALAAEGILLEDRPDGTTTWWRKD
jgi:cysteinyl-tRNA synthetase